MANPDESFEESKARKAKGQRGKSSESLVEDALQRLKDADMEFDFDRLPDTRSAGRIMPARVSDFTLFHKGLAVSLEIKEIKKGLKLDLSKAKFRQLPRMKRRELAGCQGVVVVHILETRQWFAVPINRLLDDQKGLSFAGLTGFSTADKVIERVLCDVRLCRRRSER